jgi:hypothetical protein
MLDIGHAPLPDMAIEEMYLFYLWGATQKFPKSVCLRLTTYQNFCSPPSPSK